MIGQRAQSTVGLVILCLRHAAAGKCLDANQCASLDCFPTSAHARQGQRYAEVQFAALFSIKYGRYFKVVEDHKSKEQYVLTQCGCGSATTQQIDATAPLPANYKRKFFQIPLDNVATESTVQLEFFKELGLTDRVRFVSSYAVGACWVALNQCNAGFEPSYGNSTLRTMQEAQVSAIFKDCSGNSCAAEAKTVHFSATQDPSPLNSAEHIKFIATFFNKEREANLIYDRQVTAYQNMRRGHQSPALRLAWIKKGFSNDYVISLAKYKMQFVADAGALNVNKIDIQNALNSIAVTTTVSGDELSLPFAAYGGNQSETATAFMAALSNVDVVIDESWVAVPRDYTFSSFLNTFFLDASSPLPFVANRKVFRTDGAISAANNWDWFESRVAKPEAFLADLIKAVHGESGSLRYLRNVAQNEEPRVLAGQCNVRLPACEGGVASDIPLMHIAHDATKTSGVGDTTETSGVGDAKVQAVLAKILTLLVALFVCAGL